ncbi:DoxX family protein [Ureibacillus acetophenoni]|uniref:DoxX-like protein n=1 Tax=Ureibacillus acetophenoni TaxID=614649 RepID=A0A285U2L2_9BACL|nr:DoxX family protein [Ureibacillus acetophenoni]SOC35953.1 DoxX-like protein [Ureibacillus acetophenoni]
MNGVLWVLQIGLMLIFVMDGVLKAFQYEIAKENIPWVRDVPKSLVIFVGYVEIVAGLGLIIPIVYEHFRILTPISSFIFVVLMFFATIFHYNRKEYIDIPFNITLLLMALFVMIGSMFF